MAHSLALDAVVSGMLGALIGFFCRWHVLALIILASICSISYYALVLWRFPDHDVWSWRYPITSAIYQGPWFAAFYLAPTLLVALAVAKLRARPT